MAWPRLRAAVDPELLPASRGRHPSSSPGCRTCGFAPPSRPRVAEALQRLPGTWAVTLATGEDAQLRSAAVLRDEIHGITNRILRLLAQPGAGLLPVVVPFPSAARGGVISTGPVLHVIRLAVDRLVEVVSRLRAADWDIQGTVVDTGRPVTVHDLVLVPLHHSHRGLALLTTSSVAVRSC